MEKIKYFLESEQGKNVLTVLILILVGIGSFELGRLSKSGGNGGIKIEYSDQAANALYAAPAASSTAQAAQTGQGASKGAYFASSRGSKYYPADCAAGQNIKEANKVWFETREDAERAGYELSTSCK